MESQACLSSPERELIRRVASSKYQIKQSNLFGKHVTSGFRGDSLFYLFYILGLTSLEL